MTTFEKITGLVVLIMFFTTIQVEICFAQKIIGEVNVEAEIENLKKELQPIILELYTYNWEALGSLYLINNSRKFAVCRRGPGRLGLCRRGKLAVNELRELKQLIAEKEISSWQEEYKGNKAVTRKNAGGYRLIITEKQIKKTISVDYTADVPQKLNKLIEKIIKLTKE